MKKMSREEAKAAVWKYADRRSYAALEWLTGWDWKDLRDLYDECFDEHDGDHRPDDGPLERAQREDALPYYGAEGKKTKGNTE